MDFYQTPAHICSYLPDQYSANIFVDPNAELNNKTYSWLIDHGFRRNGINLYRPHCPQCKACIPTRVEAIKFNLSRAQKRSAKTNQDLSIKIVSNEYSEEHFDLYKKYLQSRHAESPMNMTSDEDYDVFILGSWTDTKLMEFRLDNQLICVAVYDVLPQGLSAVYTFFDSEFSNRSLGTFAIVSLIQQCVLKNLKYVYLGYWIKNCQKMSYKSNFEPIEGYINNKWQVINNNAD